MIGGSQFFGAECEIGKIADAQPFPKQEADLRILVESATAGLDRHDFDALPMKNEGYDPYSGADFEDALV